MYPVHDVDAILLLSLSIATKRRPADLTEVIAAIDLAGGPIPSENKLSDAFARLSAYGLIVEVDGGVNEHTIRSVSEAGADAFVAGSAIFGSTDYAETIRRFRSLIE